MLSLLLGTYSLGALNDYYENRANAAEVQYREAHLEAVQAHRTQLKLKTYQKTLKEQKSDIRRLKRELERLKAAKAQKSLPIATEPVYASTGSPNWEALKLCESGGNYANKKNPIYRGAYQFDQSTWDAYADPAWVGKDPADAPPSVQDAAARKLYAARGAQPWPVCGAKL